MGHYEDLEIESSHRKVFFNKSILKNSQNSTENTCDAVIFFSEDGKWKFWWKHWGFQVLQNLQGSDSVKQLEALSDIYETNTRSDRRQIYRLTL